MKYVECLHPLFLFKYTFELTYKKITFSYIMSLFGSMDTSSVASSALSPESTVTSLLSRSGHLRSSLLVPEHNTTFRYRDKVQFCHSGYDHDLPSLFYFFIFFDERSFVSINYYFFYFTLLGWFRIMTRLLQPWMPTLQILRTAAMTQSHWQHSPSEPLVPQAEANWAHWETEMVGHHVDILLYCFIFKKQNNIVDILHIVL